MKVYKPTTPGRRGMTSVHYAKLLSGDRPKKALVKGSARSVGRNNAGRITVRHKGGGHKRRFRDIDFRNSHIGVPAVVKTLEYDPNRSGFIALLAYANGAQTYILAPQSLNVGDTVIADEKTEIRPGNRMPLKNIPIGTFVYNVELKPHGSARIARSAGNYAEIVASDAGYVSIKMPSSEVRKVMESAWASVGSVSNQEHALVNYGKAGRSRWKGIRPTVRGTAMNPVDHPHGGGEGRQGRGTRRAKSLWGKPTGKGQKTRRPKKYSNTLIVSRRKVGKRR